jgi:hypothetical protein
MRFAEPFWQWWERMMNEAPRETAWEVTRQFVRSITQMHDLRQPRPVWRQRGKGKHARRGG